MAKKVLLIASERPFILKLRAKLEEGSNIQLLTANTGPEGLRMAKDTRPQLVIIDFKLPQVPGLETCRRLKSDPSTEDLSVVMIVADSQLDKVSVGLLGGPDDLLVEPLSGQDAMDRLSPFLATESNAKQVISTGNEEFDSKIGGGIPLGSLMLIEGDSGAGKSVLSQQMIHGSLANGFALSMFSSENTIQTFVKQMESLSLSVLDHMLLGKLRVFPMETSSLGKGAPLALLQAMKEERDRDLIVVDSLTSSIPQSSDKEVLGFFEETKKMCSAGQTVIIIVHSHGLAKDLLIRIRSMCDAHLELHTEETGKKLVKTLTVTKVRGAEKHTGNIVSFEVEPGWGMRIIPINKVGG